MKHATHATSREALIPRVMADMGLPCDKQVPEERISQFFTLMDLYHKRAELEHAVRESKTKLNAIETEINNAKQS